MKFLVEISILSSFLCVLRIIFDGIASSLHEQCEFGCDMAIMVLNATIIIPTNNFYKICATAIVIGCFCDVFHFVVQAMNTSLNIALQIEFEAIVVAIAIEKLMSIVAVPSSMDVVSLNIHKQYRMYVLYFLIFYPLICNF